MPRRQTLRKVRHVLRVDLVVVGRVLDQERHLHHPVERRARREQDLLHVFERPARLLRGRSLARRAADVVARAGAGDEDQPRRARRPREGAGGGRVGRIQELDHAKECRRQRGGQSTSAAASNPAPRPVIRRQAASTDACYTSPVADSIAPLADLVVLDFTRVLAGPYCTRLLADLGARVVKVERAGGGDDMRKGHLQLEPGRDDQSSYFTRINVGKESLGLDLGRPETREIVRDLARKADVAVENFAPGVAARLGIDYESLAAGKPDLVYCSISGFGQTGPWRERPAFAHIVNAASGLMHLDQGDAPAPRSQNLQAADVLSGTHAFGAILAALWRRQRTGVGARIDVSMLETLIAADDVSFAAVLNGGEEIGSPRPAMGVYEIGGRHLALQTGGSADLWPRLLKMMDRPELD